MIRHGALHLAELGFRLLPLDGKKPRIRAWPERATSDRAQIEAWFRQWPTMNIGIATGRGVFVIDIDGPEGKKSARHLELPPTVEASTGCGRHLYYRLEESGPQPANTAGRLGRGIDTRGMGGYVVAPPSLHPNGSRYLWPTAPWRRKMTELPASIAAKLTPPCRLFGDSPHCNAKSEVISGQPTGWGDFSRSGIDMRNANRWFNEGKTKEQVRALFKTHSEKYAERGDTYFEYVWRAIEPPERGRITRVGLDLKRLYAPAYRQIWFYVEFAARTLRGRMVVPDENHVNAWKRWRAVAPDIDPLELVEHQGLIYNLVGRFVDVVVRGSSIQWMRAVT